MIMMRRKNRKRWRMAWMLGKIWTFLSGLALAGMVALPKKMACSSSEVGAAVAVKKFVCVQSVVNQTDSGLGAVAHGADGDAVVGCDGDVAAAEDDVDQVEEAEKDQGTLVYLKIVEQ